MNISRHRRRQHGTILQAGVRGQGTVEYTLLVTGLTISIVALTSYLGNAIGARAKSGADALSPTLANPEQIDVAFIRCQQYTETQSARSGPGHSLTQFTEAANQVSSDSAPTGRFTAANCPPLPPLPQAP